MADKYDCTEDVTEHMNLVEDLMRKVWQDIFQRGVWHDASKLNNPVEKAGFDEWTPKLRETVYGSDAYKQSLVSMGEFVKMHYAANDHHPEFYPNGVRGMTLMAVIEMLCDWMAAAKKKGVPVDLEFARQRFGLSDDLVDIMKNTIEALR